jgi:hypothetical protein
MGQFFSPIQTRPKSPSGFSITTLNGLFKNVCVHAPVMVISLEVLVHRKKCLGYQRSATDGLETEAAIWPFGPLMHKPKVNDVLAGMNDLYYQEKVWLLFSRPGRKEYV